MGVFPCGSNSTSTPIRLVELVQKDPFPCVLTSRIGLDNTYTPFPKVLVEIDHLIQNKHIVQ